MRVRLLLALLMGLSVAAAAEQHHKQQVTKSSEEKSRPAPAIKEPSQHGSSSLDLRRIEQQTAKSAGGQKTGKQHLPLVKAERERSNPPIHFGSGASAQGSGGKAAASKSRVRQKGRR